MESEDAIETAVVARGRKLARLEKIPLDRALLKLGFIEEGQLLKTLADVLDLPYIDDPGRLFVDKTAAAELGASYLDMHAVAPITSEDGKTSLLTADPGNAAVLEEVEFQLEKPVRLLIAPTHAIRKCLETATRRAEAETSEDVTARDQSAWRASQADGPIIRFVAEKMNDAVAVGASDIHFSSTAKGLGLRFRINGILVTQSGVSHINATSVMARLKVMSGMNVAERRLPQDGRISSVIGGRVIDFRVSALPTEQGESIVCRVLDPYALRLGWDKLGFEPEIEAQVKQIIEQPSGLFLVTGPTGSGKTTTLYTALTHLNSPRRKIITVEDPVEYQLDGIEQVQVHDEIGLTFANALRSILRQDPNVIMLGEIRDSETAEIACRAALVGRMVLSTLHTSSAAGAVTRLVDLGVDEFLVQDVLQGVLGQELEVAYCNECKGIGCRLCKGSGSHGRALKVDLKPGASQ
ncbi:GspE/PulE family protein [Ruegeria sp. HKCCD8929]|uniref:GspE/PulE family protein n=1 Tax=Ruegeria sp. HKCCD8929 TaxID=2683006 RepID=UPI00148784DA|nr:GspE/PulE family protein [Ruegeria sp. HKCCD8929]